MDEMETASERAKKQKEKRSKYEARRIDEACEKCQLEEPIYGDPVEIEDGHTVSSRIGTRTLVARFMKVLCDDCRVELHSNDNFVQGNGITPCHCPKCFKRYSIR